MNIKLVTNWLKNIKWGLKPPGCFEDFLESPVDNRKFCVTVGIVYEHRFAFFYWAKFYQEYFARGKYYFPKKPFLVTIDYHNDVGADNDCRPEILLELNLNDDTELGLFCLAYLNPLNDGHILPALYLDFFSDVFVLNTKKLMVSDRTYKDRYSKLHNIYYFHNLKSFVEKLSTLKGGFYLDIDLDYFTYYPDRGEQLGSAKMVNSKLIRETLNMKNSLMSTIFPKLVGLTIALEPMHCGGYKNSMRIFDILNSEFFNNSLLTDNSEWNI